MSLTGIQRSDPLSSYLCATAIDKIQKGLSLNYWYEQLVFITIIEPTKCYKTLWDIIFSISDNSK